MGRVDRWQSATVRESGGVRPGGARIILLPAPVPRRRGGWLERWLRWVRYGGRAGARL